MSVMNIKHLFLAAASLGVFAACSDYDPGLSNNVVDYTDEELAIIQEYTTNFVERYGDIDPNHTWGFGELGNDDEAMQTRTMNVNHNMWAVENSDFPLENIPGYPQATDASKYSGKYFVQDGNGYKILDAVNAGQTGYNPAGDVTDEEIAYVSAWFRTHYQPQGISVNWSSYYVQAISGDKDREYYGKMTGEKTDDWKEVIDPDQAPEGATAPCGNWVTKTDIHYTTTQNGAITTNRIDGQENILYTVDYLWAPSSSTGQADDHVLNFNWQRTNKIDEKNPTTTFYQDENTKTGNARTITYVYDSNTQHFSVHNSNAQGENHESVRYDNYVVVNLKFEIGGKKYDGYYVAFDYQFYHDQISEHSWEQDGNTYTEHKYALRDYDGYYSNYIVKIVPGDGNDYDIETETKQVSRPKTVSARVMCEDLGTTNDFDFNDVVFDVTYTGNGNCTETTVIKKKKGTGEVVSTETTYSDWTVDANGWTGQITLLASGGTLPIYVQNFDGQQFECHETLLGANNPNLKVGEKYNPINVGANVDGIESVTLSLVSGLTSTNPDNINIYVHAPSSEDRSASAQKTIVLPRAQGGQYEDVSAAPQKICVPSGTKWMKESQQIEWTHTYFRNWVNKVNDEYNFGRSMDWTTQGLVKTNLLY